MVFQFGGDDDVAGAYGVLEATVPQHIGDQVDGLRGVLGEHQFVRVGADERRDVGAALLVGVGGFLHQLMRAAVHGAVRGGEEVAFGIEDLRRPLRGGAGIEVRQLISPAHHAREDREVSPNLGEIQSLSRRRHVRLRPPA